MVAVGDDAGCFVIGVVSASSCNVLERSGGRGQSHTSSSSSLAPSLWSQRGTGTLAFFLAVPPFCFGRLRVIDSHRPFPKSWYPYLYHQLALSRRRVKSSLQLGCSQIVPKHAFKCLFLNILVSYATEEDACVLRRPKCHRTPRTKGWRIR